jgi:predicted amidophosphoribosyltransferase
MKMLITFLRYYLVISAIIRNFAKNLIQSCTKILQNYEKKMKSQTIIKMPYGKNRELAVEFNCHESVISRALNGRNYTLRGCEIRKRARQILKSLNN